MDEQTGCPGEGRDPDQGLDLLQKLMLLLSHDQHRAMCMANDAFSGAAEQEMPNSRATMGAQNDKVNLTFICHTDYLPVRRPEFDGAFL